MLRVYVRRTRNLTMILSVVKIDKRWRMCVLSTIIRVHEWTPRFCVVVEIAAEEFAAS